jgi:hypothetical protein
LAITRSSFSLPVIRCDCYDCVALHLFRCAASGVRWATAMRVAALAALAATCNDKTGRHLDCGKDTPVTNLLLAMLARVGVPPGKE